MIRRRICGMDVGDGHPVRIMGVLNVSPESFYNRSVYIKKDALKEAAVKLVSEGADIIDLGAMSTAPYLNTEIPVEKELKRLVEALKVVRSAVDIPISIDTKRREVAEAGLENGGDMINDVGGMIIDPRMAELCSDADVPAVVLAQNIIQLDDPVEAVMRSLEKSLSIASDYHLNDLLLDPAIGFFRDKNSDFLKRDLSILNGLCRLRMMGLPLCLGISRKSFIGKVLNLKDPNDRLQGSLGATSIAVYNGAHMVRTHDISETIDAVRIAEALRDEVWDSQRQECHCGP